MVEKLIHIQLNQFSQALLRSLSCQNVFIISRTQQDDLKDLIDGINAIKKLCLNNSSIRSLNRLNDSQQLKTPHMC